MRAFIYLKWSGNDISAMSCWELFWYEHYVYRGQKIISQGKTVSIIIIWRPFAVDQCFDNKGRGLSYAFCSTSKKVKVAQWPDLTFPTTLLLLYQCSGFHPFTCYSSFGNVMLFYVWCNKWKHFKSSFLLHWPLCLCIRPQMFHSTQNSFSGKCYNVLHYQKDDVTIQQQCSTRFVVKSRFHHDMK